MKANKPTQTLIAAIALALGGLGVAHAATDSQSKPANDSSFTRMDDNHDGYLSQSEAAHHGMLTAAFKDSDDNHDGKLSHDEFIKASSVDERMKVAKYVDDSVVTAKVKAELLKDSLTKGVRVGVETYHGTVQLSGFVDSQQQADKAEQIAAGVNGVKKIVNNLIVKS